MGFLLEAYFFSAVDRPCAASRMAQGLVGYSITPQRKLYQEMELCAYESRARQSGCSSGCLAISGRIILPALDRMNNTPCQQLGQRVASQAVVSAFLDGARPRAPQASEARLPPLILRVSGVRGMTNSACSLIFWTARGPARLRRRGPDALH